MGIVITELSFTAESCELVTQKVYLRFSTALAALVVASQSRAWLKSSQSCLETDDSATRPVTMEMVQSEKSATRLLRKQRKEIDATSKRHLKERCDVQRQQATVFDKLVAAQEKERLQMQKTVAKKK
jgi:hypothetical protein